MAEEEQEMELEALQSIFMDDIAPVEASEVGLETDRLVWQITIAPKDEDEPEPTEIPVRLGLVFSHTPAYPEEAPLLRARSVAGVSEDGLVAAQALLDAQAAESVGMAMIFDLATAAKEWLRSHVRDEMGATGPEDPAKKAREEEEAEEARRAELRRLGTAVTPETYAEWFEKHKAERALERAKLKAAEAAAAAAAGATSAAAGGGKGKMSGRMYFEQGAGKAGAEGTRGVGGEEEELDEDDFDDDDFDIDEDDLALLEDDSDEEDDDFDPDDDEDDE
mmetsp:Transcript_19868/g.64646  ORF Transcript_19868/g.64646 Transcript_19868/m.64646 type:complete len:278 (-) Transcript_19868:63-896(-)